MKKTILPLSVVAVCAATFVGCEWGGVHSGESWNDAYSWANFSGTYKFVSAVEESSDSSSSGSSTSSKDVADSLKFSVASSAGSFAKSGLKTPITAGSLTVNTSNGWVFKDDGNGILVFQGSGSGFSGTVSYSSGTFTLLFGAPHAAITGTASYSYVVKSGTTTTTSSGKTVVSSSPITWLNLTQKGNLLTFQDNNGVTYSGRITGASCPKADEGGYVQPGHIRFTFEATSTANSNVKLSGSISGDWSGSSSATSGTIANRTIDASYSNGRSVTQFQAVSGTTTVYAREITPTTGVTD